MSLFVLMRTGSFAVSAVDEFTQAVEQATTKRLSAEAFGLHSALGWVVGVDVEVVQWLSSVAQASAGQRTRRFCPGMTVSSAPPP